MIKLNTIYCGDALDILKTFPDESVNCCITSPPYFNLRCYSHGKQIGREETPELYISKMTEIFHEIKRVLKKDGTCWIVIGDSYRQKNLIGIPWRLAFSLQADGWLLRSDNIWNKTNGLPESVKDRCTRCHEYIFMFFKYKKYWYDAEVIKEPAKQVSIERLRRAVSNKSKYVEHIPSGQTKQGIHRERANCKRLEGKAANTFKGGDHLVAPFKDKRNKRSVWNVATSMFRGAHFATYPEALILPMVKAGCPHHGIILDPFMGAGTTGVAAKKLSRNYVGIEISEPYVKLAQDRINNTVVPAIQLELFKKNHICKGGHQ